MKPLWIGGAAVDSRARRSRVIQDPATLETVDDVFEADAADVGAAVGTRRAQARWRKVPAVERARMLHETARALREDRSRLSELLTREGGKPRIENLDEVLKTSYLLRGRWSARVLTADCGLLDNHND